ncbi:unnamed protein product [Adineta ricciae]|uniref:G-protein coupled receptors family 1 profile domain-containing protein n=1 Tax=Adineta ricciae TaxID=249248 RepID=A0A815QW96_ADIRI|nr:unnamed protein product [Adineta ricciae]CAF1469145.1 unnamed protein product [Adineta ricciae]
MSSLALAAQNLSIYLGIFALVAGVLGGLLNTIVFLSLKTFRQSSSAFYLTIMSISNLGILISGQLTRILISGYSIDWTQTSLFYCKFRIYSLQTFSHVSFAYLSLATIDQYLSTCSRPQWQQWSNIRVAHRLVILVVFLGLACNIPYAIYYVHNHSPITGEITCTNTNAIFQRYMNYVSGVTLTKILPIGLMILFGILSYRNIQQLARQTVPLVRRELDRQITIIVLVQSVITFFTITPYIVVYCLLLIFNANDYPAIYNNLQAANSISFSIYYLYHASPFYIYFCASARFRRQLKYVLFDVHLNQRCRRITPVN